MTRDNEWHDAFCCQKEDGGFALCESLEKAQEIKGLNGRYQPVKLNWNRGQPIVDFGDFQMAIVDVDLEAWKRI